MAETVLKTIGLNPQGELEKDYTERIMQLLSRLVRAEEGRMKIVNSKDLIL